MVDERAFLAALGDRPDDPALRLVYSDYLEEEGRCPEAFAQRLEAHRRQVILRPDDDAPRLRYAEVLHDNGHAGAAKFIYGQLKLENYLEHELMSLPGAARDRADVWGSWPDYLKFHQADFGTFGAGAGACQARPAFNEFAVELNNHQGPYQRPTPTVLVFRRGFVERVECLWRAWWGRPGSFGVSDTYPRLNKVCDLHPVTSVTFADTPPIEFERVGVTNYRKLADGAPHKLNLVRRASWNVWTGGDALPVKMEQTLSWRELAHQSEFEAAFDRRVAQARTVDGFLRRCWPRVRDWKYPPQGNAAALPIEEWMTLEMTVTLPARPDLMRFTQDLGAPVLPSGTGWMTRPNV